MLQRKYCGSSGEVVFLAAVIKKTQGACQYSNRNLKGTKILQKEISLYCFTLREKLRTVLNSVPIYPKLSEEYLQHWHFPLCLKIIIKNSNIKTVRCLKNHLVRSPPFTDKETEIHKLVSKVISFISSKIMLKI